MKKFDSNNRPPNSTERFDIALPKWVLERGYDDSNATMYYEIDYFTRAVGLYIDTKWDEEELIRYSLYASHRGGSFTVTDEQERLFQNTVKRVKRKAIKTKTQKQ